MPHPPRLTRAIAAFGLIALAFSAHLASQAAPPSAGVAQADGQLGGLQLVGQVGGTPRDVAVVGDTAYLAVGPRVWVLSLVDAAKPRVVGMSDVLPYEVAALRASGDRIVTVGRDASREHKNVLTVHRPNGANGLQTLGDVVLADVGYVKMEISDQLVALLGTDGPRFVDISDPAKPALFDPPALPQYSSAAYQALTLIGGLGYLFMESNDSQVNPAYRLEILDLSDPADPRPVGQLEIGGMILVTAGKTLYTVVVDHSGPNRGRTELHAIDVSEPRRPRLASTMRLSDQETGIMALTAAAGTVFVVDRSCDVTIVDASDPSALRTTASFACVGRANAATVAGGYMYVAVNSARQSIPDQPVPLPGLAVIAVGNPTAAREVWRLPVIPAVGTDAKLIGGHLYATARSDVDYGALWAFDATDPAVPMPEAVVALPVGNSRIAQDGRWLYVSGVNTGLHVIDISQPGQPRMRGSASRAVSDGPIVVRHGYVYVAGSQLFAVDVRDPDRPVTVYADLPRTFDYQVVIADMALTNDSLLFSDVNGYTAIVDVREPELPRLIRHDRIGSESWRIAADGDNAIVASTQGVAADVALLDVSSVSGTRILSRLPIPDRVGAMALAGHTAVLGTDNRTLSVMDLSDPQNPVQRSALTLPDAR